MRKFWRRNLRARLSRLVLGCGEVGACASGLLFVAGILGCSVAHGSAAIVAEAIADPRDRERLRVRSPVQAESGP